MTPRTFWDRFGGLWEVSADGLRCWLLWDIECPGVTDEGWLIRFGHASNYDIDVHALLRLGYGPLVASC